MACFPGIVEPAVMAQSLNKLKILPVQLLKA